MQMKFIVLCLLVALSFVRCAPVTDSVPMPHNETNSLNESSSANATHNRVERSKHRQCAFPSEEVEDLLKDFPIVVKQKYFGNAGSKPTSLGCKVGEVREDPYEFTTFAKDTDKKQTLCSYRVKCVEDNGFTYWEAEEKEEASLCKTWLGGRCNAISQDQIMEKTVDCGSNKLQNGEHVWDFGERLFIKKKVRTGFYCNFNWTKAREFYYKNATPEKPINRVFSPADVGKALARF